MLIPKEIIYPDTCVSSISTVDGNWGVKRYNRHIRLSLGDHGFHIVAHTFAQTNECPSAKSILARKPLTDRINNLTGVGPEGGYQLLLRQYQDCLQHFCDIYLSCGVMKLIQNECAPDVLAQINTESSIDMVDTLAAQTFQENLAKHISGDEGNQYSWAKQ